MSSHQEQNEKILDQFTKQAAPYANLTGTHRGGGASPSSSFIDVLAPNATDLVLDVACGVGRLTLMLAKLAQHVTGIDLTAAMIEQGRALQAQGGTTNVTWRVGDILPLPFPDGAFSLVVSQAAFHHLADPAAVLAEMLRVCTPDGRVAINDLSPDPAKAEALNRAEKLRDPSHVRALPSAELRALGEQLGLVEIAASSYHASRIPLDAVLATSFPKPGDLAEVRRLYSSDAQSGVDTLDLRSERSSTGEITLQYPMTFIVWQRSPAR